MVNKKGKFFIQMWLIDRTANCKQTTTGNVSSFNLLMQSKWILAWSKVGLTFSFFAVDIDHSEAQSKILELCFASQYQVWF